MSKPFGWDERIRTHANAYRSILCYNNLAFASYSSSFPKIELSPCSMNATHEYMPIRAPTMTDMGISITTNTGDRIQNITSIALFILPIIRIFHQHQVAVWVSRETAFPIVRPYGIRYIWIHIAFFEFPEPKEVFEILQFGQRLRCA